MVVHQLINALNAMNPNSPVVVNLGNGNMPYVSSMGFGSGYIQLFLGYDRPFINDGGQAADIDIFNPPPRDLTPYPIPGV